MKRSQMKSQRSPRSKMSILGNSKEATRFLMNLIGASMTQTTLRKAKCFLAASMKETRCI